MPDPLRTVSTVDAVAEALRERILSGDLVPGTPLPEYQYASEYGVARHSFRAATRVLIHEGLLRHSRNRGVHVPALTAVDISDLFRVRKLLEVEAIRSVSATGDPTQALVDAVRDLSRLRRDASWRSVVDHDMRFHRALMDAVASPRLSRAYAMVSGEIIHCLVQLRPHYDGPKEVAREHKTLLAAIAAGNPDHATALLQRHIDDAASNLVRAASNPSGGLGHYKQPSGHVRGVTPTDKRK